MNDLLNQLPEYDPHPDLWARIDADLTADAQLSRTVGDLPQHEPRADLWSAIERDLNEPVPTPVIEHPAVLERRANPFRRTIGLWGGLVAAAVVVLVGIWLALRPTEIVRMEYAVETAPAMTEPFASATTDADDRAEQFIKRQCAEQQLACQRPEVHDLRNQLEELTSEQQRLTKERQTFGDDPALIRAQVQVENQRVEVMKELITILRS